MQAEPRVSPPFLHSNSKQIRNPCCIWHYLGAVWVTSGRLPGPTESDQSMTFSGADVERRCPENRFYDAAHCGTRLRRPDVTRCNQAVVRGPHLFFQRLDQRRFMWLLLFFAPFSTASNEYDATRFNSGGCVGSWSGYNALSPSPRRVLVESFSSFVPFALIWVTNCVHYPELAEIIEYPRWSVARTVNTMR